MNEIILDLIDYFKNDVKRINHALKVYSFALVIGENENLTDEKKTIIKLTSILHDVGIKESERKYNSTAGNYQEIEGPPIAEAILGKRGICKEITNRVCYIVGNHHTYANIDDIDFQILVEADLIVNIYEDEANKKDIENVYNKIFKTKTGKYLLQTMYLG